MNRSATAADELPAFFPAGDDELFGILTHPTVESNGMAIVMLQGGAWVPSTGRNRLWVRMARSLASRGFHALRIDYHGVGESTGDIDNYRLDRPFVTDVEGAIRWIEGRGVSEFVLMGTCFGARTALASAERVTGLRGVALCPPPVRDFEMGNRIASRPLWWHAQRALRPQVWKGLVNRKRRGAYGRIIRAKARDLVGQGRGRVNGTPPQKFSWVSPNFLRPLQRLVEREIPVLIVYGTTDDFYDDFNRGLSKGLGELLAQAGDLITLILVEGTVHGLGSLEIQDAVAAAVERWLREEVVDRPAPPTTRAPA
ncbi:MAG: alpha/beta fold hydrolase [Actinomycetota bacterium]|nr:alpha/beta fold hydrolase [Actinomycetota bacterium]